MSEKVRILVADDEESIRGILCQVLKEEGYDVSAAANGEDALEIFRKDPFPLVITDIRMGEMSGIQLLLDVKRLSPETEVIIITSYASMGTAILALRAGVYDYLMKPFEELDLVTSAVKRATDKIRLNQENRALIKELRRKNEDLERLNRTLQDMAFRDGLTGLYNHRHFQEALISELSRSRRHGRDLSLIIMDVDNFKNYNDAHGHLHGDSVLRTLAEIIMKRLRASDVAARYGGEEFVVLLPETARETAVGVAEDIRKTIEKHPFPGEEVQPLGKITVSMGVSSFPKDGADPSSLFHYADVALYKAKQAGRNLVS